MAELQPIYVRVCDSRMVFGISRSTIYEMASRGEITIHKVGGKSLLKVEEVASVIEKRKFTAQQLGG